eukprot:CAMPEP_0179004922 /NCGR_PEP_ID=MMETSP0795-20121207/13596_1 /TAXON_ID=88552 /ORGANISM="Amoebophrya sp., Strain Ameob2" /LENGTH=568 /DNA_ID=CAMNT_0020699283 /DNA_START=529 /DNA_END=2235 /DNA_ORIENTATION=+
MMLTSSRVLRRAATAGASTASSSSSSSTTTSSASASTTAPALNKSAPIPQFGRKASIGDPNRERLVVLGSGWAGYPFLRAIDTSKYQTIMVSPRNHFLFTPLLANAAVGGSDISSICQPVRTLCADKSARFYEGKAVGLDKENKSILCKALDGRTYPLKYDKLIISCGFQANDFGIKNLQKHAFFMKETADAARVHDHVLTCFEEASALFDGDKDNESVDLDVIKKILSFVTVGAGPTGTEFCAELASFIKHDIERLYPYLADHWAVHLIEGGPQILSPFRNEKLQNYAARHLTNVSKVQIHLNSPVEAVEENLIKLKTGVEIEFSTLVWCAGIKALPFVQKLDLVKNKNGTQLLTDGWLKVKGEKNIYAMGDCATIEDNLLPQTAQIASQQAEFLAKNLNKLASKPAHRIPALDEAAKGLPVFKHVDRGMLAYVGGTAALYRAPNPFPNLTGMIGYFTWRSAYWSMQLSMRNRMLLASDWFQRALFGRDVTRIGTHSNPTDVARTKSAGGYSGSGVVKNTKKTSDNSSSASAPSGSSSPASEAPTEKSAAGVVEETPPKRRQAPAVA